jgi:hypothetical protein
MTQPISIVPAASITAQSRPAGVYDLDRDPEPVVEFDGTWPFHPGDDARSAAPDFDDAHWPVLKGTEGWSSHGYPCLSGFAWYRAVLLVPDRAIQVNSTATPAAEQPWDR